MQICWASDICLLSVVVVDLGESIVSIVAIFTPAHQPKPRLTV